MSNTKLVALFVAGTLAANVVGVAAAFHQRSKRYALESELATCQSATTSAYADAARSRETDKTEAWQAGRTLGPSQARDLPHAPPQLDEVAVYPRVLQRGFERTLPFVQADELLLHRCLAATISVLR